MRASGITDSDRSRISAAIERAEKKTTGEIYVVIDREEHGYPLVPVLWGAVLALFIAWPLYFATYLDPTVIFLLQAVTFVSVALFASIGPLHRLLVPDILKASRARDVAEALFMAHGVHLTAERTGLLIYIAMVERRVEIVADENINTKVDQNTWDELAHMVIVAARADQLADGLINTIDRAADILALYFPPGATNPNELPDRVVEI
jgi:putative membrane protein